MLIIAFLCLMITILLTSVEYHSFHRSFFHRYQEENQISEKVGVSPEKLDRMTEDLFTYLQEGDATLLADHFNTREIDHMKDVYDLFQMGIKIRMFSVLLFVVFITGAIAKFGMYCVVRSMKRLTWGFLGLFGVIAGLIFFNFNAAFITFHHLLFDNDLWILDPKTDLMIRMLPLDFFITLFVRILIYFVGGIVLLQVIQYILLKHGKDKTCNQN